jgi:hypothetical protein
MNLHIEPVFLPQLSTPEKFRKNFKYFPYFRDCIRALDSSHISTYMPEKLTAPFQNSKRILTQVISVICSFDIQYSYVLASWEGSAHNRCILQYALSKSLYILVGKYFLKHAEYS